MSSLTAKIKKPRTQAALVLLLSISVGFGTYFYLLNYQSRIESANDLKSVYVARSEIASGTSYAEISAQNLLDVREVPAKSLPVGAVTPDSKIDVNLKTRGPLASGQILVASYFSADAGPDVGLTIPKGMLAITVSVDDVSRVGNFVAPGSRVVIFSTSANSAGNSQTKVLIPEALVIAIGTQTNQSANPAIPTPSPLVTFALTPGDVEKLLASTKAGQITLALAYDNNPYALVGANRSQLPRIESGN